jgi:hypothetical protein
VADLEAGIDAYTRIGFELRFEDGCAIAANEKDFLQLKKSLAGGLHRIVLEADDPKAKLGLQHVAAAPAAPRPAAMRHPNGVLRLERVYIAVEDIAAAAAEYGRALGMPVPKLERGTVINADMAAFNIGGAGLTLAQPAGPGVAADALARRGPGPFQALYRTSSMDAASRWMADHGVPPPQRGIRNTGEQAMLVPPEYACGAWIGFVGLA